jgi:hypothetical protein
MKKIITAAVATAFLLSTTGANASVTFDSSTGAGFVGKGDVQLAFGWNNAQLQRSANGVTFTHNSAETYDVTCEWDTETGGPRSRTIHHDITIPRRTSVSASVSYDARTRNQITGFMLTGFGAIVYEGTVPVVGGSCPGNNPGEVTEVMSTGSSGDNLTVNSGGVSVSLPNTPVL